MNALTTPISKARKALTLGLMAATAGAAMLGAVSLGSSEAAAQSVGKPHQQVVKVLRDRYDEAPAFIGLATGGAVVEVFTSEDGSTWTIVMTLPNGLSSIIAAGESWESVKMLVGQPI